MDIPPLIRPVLPSPLKHDGSRHTAVTQWEFFIERPNKHNCTNTPTQTHRHLVITAPERTYSDAIVRTSRRRDLRDVSADRRMHKNIHIYNAVHTNAQLLTVRGSDVTIAQSFSSLVCEKFCHSQKLRKDLRSGKEWSCLVTAESVYTK